MMTINPRYRAAGPAFNLLVIGLALMVLGACASNTRPAPVEERDIVSERVREPARQQSEGVQVRPLQNPAVQELLSEARDAQQLGEFERAEGVLERALRVSPRDPELLQEMAEVQLEQRNFEQGMNFAIRSFEVGPRVGELCARNWRTIAVAREYMGNGAGSQEAERRADECMNKPKPRY